jgi:hypothetical protein
MNITYTKQGDYLIPDLKLKEKKSVKLGRYAKLRLKFIKYEMKPFYQKLLMEDKLTEYLFEIEAKANEMEINLMNCMKKQLKIDEELKEKDQMKWVQMMNNIANSTQEMVLNKIIYSYRTN